MGILDQGCMCDHCSNSLKVQFQEARQLWDSGTREITFESYHHQCGDGCCDSYGTDVYVNGFNLNCNGDDAEHVIEAIMEFLGVDNVNIGNEYEDDLYFKD